MKKNDAETNIAKVRPANCPKVGVKLVTKTRILQKLDFLTEKLMFETIFQLWKIFCNF